MHAQLTMSIFALMTAGLIVVRLTWRRLSIGAKRAVLMVALIGIALWPFSELTGWNTTSDRLNSLMYWGFVGSYEMLLILFTLLRPYWLTGLFTLTLLVPVLSASAFLPLEDVFDRTPQTTKPMGDHLWSQLVPFTYAESEVTGADLEIYRRPAWLPFLQHKTQGARYYNTQCDAMRAFATLQPDGRHLLMNCPAAEGKPYESGRVLMVRLH